jgi:hypothetical protein
MSWVRNLSVILISLALVPGCGYTLRSGTREDVRTINIVTFENKTFEHGLEVNLSKVLTREFILDGTLSIVDISNADVQLGGEIVEYVLEPYTYGEDESDVQQYRIQVRADVALRREDTGETVWEERRMEGDAAYYVSGALARTEDEALELALYELAKRIVSRTVKGW